MSEIYRIKNEKEYWNYINFDILYVMIEKFLKKIFNEKVSWGFYFLSNKCKIIIKINLEKKIFIMVKSWEKE